MLVECARCPLHEEKKVCYTNMRQYLQHVTNAKTLRLNDGGAMCSDGNAANVRGGSSGKDENTIFQTDLVTCSLV